MQLRAIFKATQTEPPEGKIMKTRSILASLLFVLALSACGQVRDPVARGQMATDPAQLWSTGLLR
jgi:hypothetical protein